MIIPEQNNFTLTPISSPESFLGKEHFRAYGDASDISCRMSGLIFGGLVDPYSRVRQNKQEDLKDFIEANKILIAPRDNTNLPPIPDGLKTVGFSRLANTSQLAITVRSAKIIAENAEHYSTLVGNFSTLSISGLYKISEIISSEIADRPS